MRYSQPVSSLLKLGEPETFKDDWPDYPAHHGFTAEHVPELLRMAIDNDLHDTDGAPSFAPIHAMRVLGQLQATDTVPALLDWLDDASANLAGDDWTLEEMPIALAAMGAGIAPALLDCWQDAERSEMGSKLTAFDALLLLSESDNAARQAFLAAIDAGLAADDSDAELNSYAVAGLIDLGEAESRLDVIRAGLANGSIDFQVCGDIEDIEIRLGLRQQRDTPPPVYLWQQGENGEVLVHDASQFGSFVRDTPKVGRNDPCPCGSGKKYKKCCGA